MPSQKPTLTVRIPEDIRKKLEEQASNENRSISNMLTVIMKEYFDEKENPLPQDKKVEDLLTNNEHSILDKIKSLPIDERKAILDKLT